MKKIFAVFAGFFYLIATVGAPREIVLVRHADRIQNVAYAGQFLSAKGEVRAVRFSSYFLKKFGTPDFLFATKPSQVFNFKESPSFRSIQTVAPLANRIGAIKKQNTWVLTPYEGKQYQNLVNEILQNKQYQNKLVLICWEHGKINAIAHALGVKKPLPPFEATVYDSVYVFHYSPAGKLTAFQLLKNQYPINKALSWKAIEGLG